MPRSGWADVSWVLSQNVDKTLLICKYVAFPPRAHVFSIRAGTAATLAQMHHYYGEELCTACDICELYMGMPMLIRENTREERHRRQRRRFGEPSGSC